LITLVRQIGRWGFRLLDTQVHTPHVAQLGARPLRRSAFLNLLRQSVPEASRPGRWQLDADLAVGRDELEGDAPAG
ncbi:MAG TPA: leucyl/phenylalanyl-tRNA--protein transferase, partial [Anaerolineae bacterium]|nr:leucyl/phenylalanyl-tRNA--protein transferase [Anaerolineae bacterium]